jgi:5-methylcytosine-specific restriction endonuclease McrA
MGEAVSAAATAAGAMYAMAQIARESTDRVAPVGSILRAYVGRPCPYCGRSMAHKGTLRASWDHVHPKAKGGRLEDGNGLIVCQRCNSDKGDRTIGEWLDALRTEGDSRARHVELTQAARNRFDPAGEVSA